jgi:hypothetical protein
MHYIKIRRRKDVCCGLLTILSWLFSFLLLIVILGSCQCKELAKKVQELKLINAERNNRIGILELQIKAEDFPHRQKVKELEDGLSLYQSKVIQLKSFNEMKVH